MSSFRTRTRSAALTALGVGPYSDVWTDTDVVRWITVTGGGSTVARSRWPRWPSMATTGNGLTSLVDSTYSNSQGVDFSRDASLPAMTSATGHSVWDAVNKRLAYRTWTDPALFTLDNMFVPGAIDLTAANLPSGATVRNCVFDGEMTQYTAMGQKASPAYPSTFERCEFYNEISVPCSFNRVRIIDSYVHTSKSDAFRFGGTRPKLLIRNMAPKLGQIDPITHADVVQTTTGGASDIITFGNMFYMPHTGGPYDEATYGTTNVLNYTPTGGNLSHIMSVNDCLIGGGYTVAICPLATTMTNGVALVGSWFSKPGAGYTQYGSFYPGQTKIGTAKNILIHNCRYIEDGWPVRRSIFDGGSANGLWDFDKATAPARFKQICQMLGYTDWNDDPIVAVKTAFHKGTVV